MIFASFGFLCLFLPVFLCVHFLAPARWRNLVILLFSWAFYAWWRIDFLALLVGVTVANYGVGRAMARLGPHSRGGGWLMRGGIIGNLGVLGYFKYANFGVATLFQLLGAGATGPVGWTAIVLPIGMSFYILQSISYLVDIRRGVVTASDRFIDYAAYKAVFAQLIAGPIVRYAEIAGELGQRPQSLPQFGAGGRIFMIGFAMKAVVADTLAPLVDAAFGLDVPTAVDAWIGASGYTLQLYFDFAGYSAMAIGLARMIGFHFPANFHDPYLAGSIRDFWRRWHMTLSRFLRDYLYIPLGGNRLGSRRTALNLLATMALGGLWHGANWTFLIWGIWHGGLLALHRWWSARPGPKLPFVVAHGLTMLAVLASMVVFRASNLAQAARMLSGMIGLHGGAMSDQLAWQATADRIWFIPIALALVYLPWLRRLPLPAARRLQPLLSTLGPLAAFGLAVVLLYSRDAVPFLYFQF